jgi:pSer/pThr/pTyr-binding forkhead associated (FHA) protein
MEANPPSPDGCGGLPSGSDENSQPNPPTDFVALRLVLQPSGAIVELDRPDMLVGRHSEADVRLPLPDVSRRHCRFVFGEGRWQVIDLGSLNGVFVNDEAVVQAVLQPGDTVRIGGFHFVVELASSGSPVEDADHLARSIFRIPPRRRAS